jgi:hypothetical protein
MLKSSPRLRMLDISGLIYLRLYAVDKSNRKGMQHDLVAAVAEARHASLRLNCIQINRHDLDASSWEGLDNLNDMKFVGA